jgi:hypothetical protein
VLAVVPFRIAQSQRHLDRSVKALQASDCTTAMTEAREARSALSIRPEPNEVLGICQGQTGDPATGTQTLQQAIDDDPRNWELHYELALVRGMAGSDPYPQLTAARRLNPYDPMVLLAAKRFKRRHDPARWRDVARTSPVPGVNAGPSARDAAASPSAADPARARPTPGARRKG